MLSSVCDSFGMDIKASGEDQDRAEALPCMLQEVERSLKVDNGRRVGLLDKAWIQTSWWLSIELSEVQFQTSYIPSSTKCFRRWWMGIMMGA
jgi:hypothetical protein